MILVPADGDNLIAAASEHSAAKWIRLKRYYLYFGQQYTVDNILLHVLS